MPTPTLALLLLAAVAAAAAAAAAAAPPAASAVPDYAAWNRVVSSVTSDGELDGIPLTEVDYWQLAAAAGEDADADDDKADAGGDKAAAAGGEDDDDDDEEEEEEEQEEEEEEGTATTVAEDYEAWLRSLRTAETDAGKVGKEEVYAMFMNAYNSMAMRKVRDHPCKVQREGGEEETEGSDVSCVPIESINDVQRRAPNATDVWDQPVGVIGGKVYSLNQIEDLLRHPQDYGYAFGEDARVHGCIVCASISCPNVAKTAYTPTDVDAQMDANVKDWLANEQKGMLLDKGAVRITLSKIFYWYDQDFADTYGSVLAFVEQYVSEEDSQFISEHEDELNDTMEYFDYDWDVNGPVPCEC